MSRSTESAVYYDPYDVAINADPYPAFRRLREEAPLYYNEQYDFYALSRFEDVERGFVDHHTFSSAHGGVLEAIKAGYRAPNGVFIMEDPPVHTAHRGVLARVFTPKKMNALEPQIRAYCAEVLDPLVGTERFDFVTDLGAKMPMRVIGMLLGIPEEDQEAIRRQADERIRREPGKPHRYRADHFTDDEFFGDYIDWRAEHPSDDLMTELLLVEFEDETGTIRRLTPRRDPHLRQGARVGRERDDESPDRLEWEGARRAPRPAPRARSRPVADPERDRGDPAVRATLDQRARVTSHATSSSTARRCRRGVR